MNILFVHPISEFGGASKSLLEFCKVLKQNRINPLIFTPNGESSHFFKRCEIKCISFRGRLSQFDNTNFGHYAGKRWLILAREIIFIPFCLLSIFKLRNVSFDVIHVNEITAFPFSIILKLLWRKPLVVHVRSVQWNKKGSFRCKVINYLLNRYADRIIAIDHTVADSLGANIYPEVVHNSFKISDSFEKIYDFKKDFFKIGFLGGLLPMKGVRELCEAFSILRCKKHYKNVTCIIAGKSPRDTSTLSFKFFKLLGFVTDLESELDSFIKKNNLQDNIKLVGFIDNTNLFFEEIDLLCFPSHLDAIGRPVIEAGLHGIPSLVTLSKKYQDTLEDNISGMIISECNPILIAEKIELFIRNEDLRTRISLGAKTWASTQYDIELNVAKLLDVYSGLVHVK